VFVGVYRIELQVPESRSLKAKRSVTNSLKARLQKELGVSVAEVEGQDTWQHLVLAAAAVSADPGWLETLADRIEALCLREGRARLLRVGREVRPADPRTEFGT
jgi:uncharacterized protein YlxP (DUF503 family)